MMNGALRSLQLVVREQLTALQRWNWGFLGVVFVNLQQRVFSDLRTELPYALFRRNSYFRTSKYVENPSQSNKSALFINKIVTDCTETLRCTL